MNIAANLAVTLFLIQTNAFAVSAPTQTVMNFDQKEGKLEFHATGHPSAVKVNGEGPIPKGTLTLANGKLNGSLTVDMTKLDTGISLRTNHMKEKALEVDKYPEAKLVITDMKLIAGADSIPFRGDLTLHGETKPIEGKAKVERKEDSMNVHADFDLKLSDYKIIIKPFAGISMDDKVAVVVDSKAVMESVTAAKP